MGAAVAAASGVRVDGRDGAAAQKQGGLAGGREGCEPAVSGAYEMNGHGFRESQQANQLAALSPGGKLL